MYLGEKGVLDELKQEPQSEDFGKGEQEDKHEVNGAGLDVDQAGHACNESMDVVDQVSERRRKEESNDGTDGASTGVHEIGNGAAGGMDGVDQASITGERVLDGA